MKLLPLKIAAIGLFMLIAVKGYSQQTAKLSGTVADSLTHEPIQFATVALLDEQTKAPVKATQTDTSGRFVFEDMPVGAFILRITYVGYNNILKENILFKSETGNLNLGTLVMSASKNSMLKEVAVISKKDALKNIDGKKVFSVNQSLVSKGGNAADLLQNVPTLQIDANGNVSLRGSTNVKVLVDGKPTIIANGDVARILQSIPASAIENIEVIPNPPASYDANGEGIINIILKKNSRPGLNGSVNIGGGTNDNYNADASLSYQSGKVNVYGNYSLKNGNTVTTGTQLVTFLQPADSVVHSNEIFPTVTRNKIQFVKAGIDYALTPLSTLGVSASFNSRAEHADGAINVNDYNAANALIESYNQYNTVNNNGYSYELDLDYTRRFKKPKEQLAFNFAYAYGSFRDYEQYTTFNNPINGRQSTRIDTPLISDTRHKSTNYNIQADYVLPVGKAGQFSAGYRSQITLGNNDQYAYYILNTGQTPLYTFTDFFSSNSQVNAVYLSYKDQVGNFSYQAGVRGEDSHLNATFFSYDANNLLVPAPVKVPVKGVYPSVLLTQKLESNSDLQFTFARRISRPAVREVNSTTDFSDASNYNKGNPALMPESVTNLELDYNKTWQNMSFTGGIYNNTINNAIHHIETAPVNNETTTTPENFKYSITTGLELIGHFDLVKGWDLTANANIFNRDDAAAPQFGIRANNAVSWDANITSNITPVQRLSFQVRASYRAADALLQDKNRANFLLNAAAKYDFKGNRASLSFNANNIFDSPRAAFLRSSDAVLLNFERYDVSSRATFTFSYRFGSDPSRQKEPKQPKRIEDAS